MPDEPPRLLRLLLKGAGIAFAIQVGGAGLRYVSQVFFARWLGPHEYGEYAFAISWAFLLSTVAMLGLHVVVLRFMPEYETRGRWKLYRGIFLRTRQLVLLAGVAIAAVGTAASAVRPVPEVDRATFWIALWLIPIFAMQTLQASVGRSLRRMVVAYGPSLVSQPVLGLLLAYLLDVILGGLSSETLLVAVAAAALIVTGAHAVLLERSLPGEARRLRPEYETRKWMLVGVPLLLTSGFITVLSQVDVICLGYLRGAFDAGIYHAARRTATLVSFILLAMNSMSAPMISSLHAAGDRAGLQRLVGSAVRWTVWPSVAVAAVLWLFARPVLALFGEPFEGAVAPLAILVAAHLVNAVAGPVGILMNLTGGERAAALVYGVAAAANVALNILLIPPLGGVGAALATAGSMILWNVWLLVLVRRRLGITLFLASGSARAD